MITAVDSPVAALEPIGLTELVAEAELLSRFDRKYVVDRADLDLIMARLPAGVRILEIDHRREFGYRSTYLDTADRLSYHLAGRNRRHRWKIRGRRYLDDGTDWLEIKTAGPQDRTIKRRIPTDRPVEAGLAPAATAFLADAVGPVAADLRPVITTHYRRRTLLLPGCRSRVTVDTDLSWTTPAGDGLDRPDLMIIETKGGARPGAVDHLLWRAGHRPVRLSKFGVGLAALQPDLPRLKWHRTLSRHLDLPRTIPTRSQP